TLIITSRTPKLRKRESVISSSVRPLISTSALGRSSVRGRKRVPRPAARIIAFIGPSLSWIQLLLLAMMYHHLHSILAAQMFCQLLRQIYGSVLAAGTTERHHQVLEPAVLIGADACVHQRLDAGEKLTHAFRLIEIVDYRRVLAGEGLEALFAPGIREAATIENEAAAVAGLVLRRQASVK